MKMKTRQLLAVPAFAVMCAVGACDTRDAPAAQKAATGIDVPTNVPTMAPPPETVAAPLQTQPSPVESSEGEQPK